MKTYLFYISISFIMMSCSKNKNEFFDRIIFLHHSTGEMIMEGQTSETLLYRGLHRVSARLALPFKQSPQLTQSFETYNKKNQTNYLFSATHFPKSQPYGWNNFPYDYYNIWVKNAGNKPYLEEPSLEILTQQYNTIILKHCFPVCNIQENLDVPSIDSDIKTLAHYKLQYQALKQKFLEFPDTKFILFTGAVQTKALMSEAEAMRARDFFDWVKNDWNNPNDNIFIWDLYSLQTEGQLYFKDDYATSLNDPHPNKKFVAKASDLLFNRIIDVIENKGSKTTLTGKPK